MKLKPEDFYRLSLIFTAFRILKIPYSQNRMNPTAPFDTKRDLTFSRLVPVKRALMWRAWTEPELLMQWFCPRPWKTVQCDIDLRPGGKFETTMLSPEGQRISNIGCYLEIVDAQKLVWTNAFLPGFRPKVSTDETNQPGPNFIFTGVIEFADSGQDTQYTATVLHADAESCQKHADMGFEIGWDIALDQMVQMIKEKG